jgi:hypothetical protein
MKTPLVVLGIGMMLAATESPCAGSTGTGAKGVRPSIPYVASRNDAVRDMLWMANVGKDDIVCDLGSGDGRIVIAAVRDFGARRAVGVEIDPNRIRESRANAQKAAVADRVEFIQGDLFKTDFRQASVVALFLGHKPNIELRPKLFRILKPGTRIVSHQFAMGEWPTDKEQTVRTVFLGMRGLAPGPFFKNPRVPDYRGNDSYFETSDKILMWVIPASVAGVWRGKIETAQGPRDFEFALHQRLSEPTVRGTFEISGQNNVTGRIMGDVWGDHLRFICSPDRMPYGQFQVWFDGNAEENTMKGTLTVKDRDQLQQSPFEAQRDKANLAGTWEWPSLTPDSHSVRLRIDRRDGHPAATYIDGDREFPVPDFYDFGGGFYFTLLIGRREHGLRLSADTGWLIGNGVLKNGVLEGMIEFHPSGAPRDKESSVFREWAAHPAEQ